MELKKGDIDICGQRHGCLNLCHAGEGHQQRLLDRRGTYVGRLASKTATQLTHEHIFHLLKHFERICKNL